MSHVRVLWVDIGMVVAAVIGVVIVVFLYDAEFIVPLMVFYMLALMAWAFVAETAAVRAEEAEQRSLRTPASGVEPRPYERLSH
jgi:hypothetical protein